MKEDLILLFPVARFVSGSLYEPQRKDKEGRPLIIKSGPNAGQPAVKFYFAIAIKKGVETHWSQTDWGAKIYAHAAMFYPAGQYQSPTFSWKILDGDSTEVNSEGNRPCDNTGFPGHWVVRLQSGFPPKIYNRDGTAELTEKDQVLPGYFLEVVASIRSNDSPSKPGIYINHKMLALAGYGDVISWGPDAKEVFGKAQLPGYVSSTPIASANFNAGQSAAQALAPAPAAQVVNPPVAAQALAPAPVAQVVNPPVAVQPYPEILMPTPTAQAAPPAAPTKNMTAKANGMPYEAWIKQGWSDETLIQYGYMV